MHQPIVEPAPFRRGSFGMDFTPRMIASNSTLAIKEMRSNRIAPFIAPIVPSRRTSTIRAPTASLSPSVNGCAGRRPHHFDYAGVETVAGRLYAPIFAFCQYTPIHLA
ncbi:hypothetical protein FRC09_000919 [Ceratobasidium sp. 395]|nr:hypothetical protein FRC09_000919 [Ceratobasidium sp. 395]